MSIDMNCDMFQTTLLDLVYGELDQNVENQAREHIEKCESCRLSFHRLNQSLSLASQLPQVEPSKAVDDKIIRNASRHLHLESLPLIDTKGSKQQVWHKVIDSIGRLAMGRQFAMATVMLLVVAVGLWYLPQLRRKPNTSGGVVLSPDPLGEAGPSGQLTPAAPLDLAMDLQRGRIRPKSEHPQSNRNKGGNYRSRKAAISEHPIKPLHETLEGHGIDLESSSSSEDTDRPSKIATPSLMLEENLTHRNIEIEEQGTDLIEIDQGDSNRDSPQIGLAEKKRTSFIGTSEERQERSDSFGAVPEPSSPNMEEERQERSDSFGAVSEPSSPNMEQERQERSDSFGAVSEPSSPNMGQERQERSVSTIKAAPPSSTSEYHPLEVENRLIPENRTPDSSKLSSRGKEAPTPYSELLQRQSAIEPSEPQRRKTAPSEWDQSIEKLYQRGIARYRSANYKGAIDDLNRVVEQVRDPMIRPNALIHLARSYRSSGRCSSAIHYYESLISEYPGRPGNGFAMIEAAGCLIRLGRKEDAKKMLERASRVPAVADAAKHQLETMER